MRITAVAARACTSSRSKALPLGRSKIEADNAGVGQALFPARAESPQRPARARVPFIPASDRMNNCSATARRQFSGTSIAPSRAQA